MSVVGISHIHASTHMHAVPHEMEATGWAAPENQHLRFTAGLHMHQNTSVPLHRHPDPYKVHVCEGVSRTSLLRGED